MATITSTIKLVDQMTPTLNKISKAIDRVNTQSKQVGSMKTWSGFNTGVTTATRSTHGLYRALRRVAYTLATISSLRALTSAADAMMNATARINNINDGLYTTSQYLDIIYQAAQRSRGSFSGMVTSVGKLGTVAGQAFGSVNEMIAFVELMNKLFVLSGASATEASSAMYQLTQAMAAGRLQGDEMRSILENAPLLAQKIADSLGVTTGELKELGAEGVITADIIKNALFEAADDIEEKFEKMPKTIGQTWTEICNYALNAFRPVIERVQAFINSPVFDRFKQRLFSIINSIANAIIRLFDAFENPRVQAAIQSITNALTILWNVAKSIADAMVKAIIWIADNWSWLGQIIYAVAMIMLLFKAIMVIATAALWAYNAAKLVMGLITGSVVLTTLGWVVVIMVAIVLAVYAAVAAWNHFTNSTVSATGVLLGAIAFVFVAIGQLASKLWDTAVYVGQLLSALAINLGSWVINVCTALGLAILEIGRNIAGTFQWLGAVIGVWGSNILSGMQQLCAALPDYWEYFKLSVVAKFWGIIAGAVGAFNSLIQGARDTCVKMLSPFADFANGVKNIINKIKSAWNALCNSLSFSISLPDWLGGHSWTWSASGYAVDIDNTPITAEGWIGAAQSVSNSASAAAANAAAAAAAAGANLPNINWSSNAMPGYGDYANWGSVGNAWNEGMNTSGYVNWPSYNVDWTDWQASLDAFNYWYNVGAGVEEGIGGLVNGIGGLLSGLLGGGGSGNSPVDVANLPSSLEGLLNGFNPSNNGVTGPLDSIAGNTGGIASNVDDMMDLNEDELALLQSIAEQEILNNFTTAEIVVNMSNNNNINSNMDLDGIVTHLSTRLHEELGVVANGVYY